MEMNKKTGKPFNSKHLKVLEKMMSRSMPADLRNFLEEYNGGRPESNCFAIPSADNDSIINEFLSIQEIVLKKQSMHDRFLEMVIPIAYDVCGNYVCLSFETENEGLYFWDHELETDEGIRPTWDNMFYLAATFTEFLNQLEKNVDDIKLNPEDVKSVWIDPDFLEEMKRKGYVED